MTQFLSQQELLLWALVNTHIHTHTHIWTRQTLWWGEQHGVVSVIFTTGLGCVCVHSFYCCWSVRFESEKKKLQTDPVGVQWLIKSCVTLIVLTVQWADCQRVISMFGFRDELRALIELYWTKCYNVATSWETTQRKSHITHISVTVRYDGPDVHILGSQHQTHITVCANYYMKYHCSYIDRASLRFVVL